MRGGAALLVARALTEPLAINDQWYERLKSIAVNPGAFLDLEVDADFAELEAKDILENIAGVNVISVDGPLSKSASMWTRLFGGATYEGLCTALDQSASNGGPVVIKFDSPGGGVYGCGETASRIRALREDGRMVIAYVEGQADSAAYWLASQCGWIIINPSGEAGSIGVRCAMVDDSVMLANYGVKLYDIVADQSPLKVADASKEEDRARVKKIMSDYAAVFIADVASGREVDASEVQSKFGKGDVMVGQLAVDAGLADEVGTLDSVLAELSAQPQEKRMKTPISAAAPKGPTASVDSGKCSACSAEMGGSDKMYCEDCYGGEDAKKAHAFAHDVQALVGGKTLAEAVGIITAMKAQASTGVAASTELGALQAKVAKMEAEQQAREVDALVAGAVGDGRLAPARVGDMHALAAKHGVDALKASLSFLQKPATKAIEPTEEKAAQAHAQNVFIKGEGPSAAGLTADELKIIKATGSTPEKFLAHRAKLVAATTGKEGN